jgi:hypothetical protein
MKRIGVLRMLVLLLVCVAIALPGLAKKKKSFSTEPGTYEEWHDDIDKIEIVATFSMADYTRIVVTGFETDDVDLPDKDDNTYEPVLEVLKDVVSPFVEGLKAELGKPGVTVEAGLEGGAGSLVISGKVLEMDPGSKAARYWGGFGAGAARGHVEIVVTDGATGDVLLRIDQERRSGVGMFGGDYVKLMQNNMNAIGEDMALVFSKF